MVRSEADKLVELKEMLIGVKILKNRSDDDWDVYKGRNEENWIFREGLKILLTEEVMDLVVDKSEREVWWIFRDFILLSTMSSCAVQCSLVRLCTSVSDKVGKCWDGWKRQRVMCWVVGQMVELQVCYVRKDIPWSEEITDYAMDHLVKVLEGEDMKMVKWAILTGEKLWVKMKMNSERRDRLHKALTRHSQTHTNKLVEEMDRDGWDAERYQAGWCARWCEQNMGKDFIGKMPLIKMSPDRFEARNENRDLSPVCSPFLVKSNVYFYEVICVTNGEMYLGWTTRETLISVVSKIKCLDEYWIGLQEGNNCFVHQDGQQPNNPTTSHSSLNVIGCLIDLENRRFEFFLNGQPIDYIPPQSKFSPPYFATVCLSQHQQCHLNFGQCPFKFPPRNIRFTTFHEQTEGDERKYRLMVTEEYNGDFWFAHTPVDNQVSLYFDDEMQNEVNREVKRVVGDIENDAEIWKWRWDRGGKDDYHFYYIYIDPYSWRGLRYMQAIIEVMSNVYRVDKVDVMAHWVGQMIEGEHKKMCTNKLFQLLYPYLQLTFTKPTLTQHRSICIILLHLIKNLRNRGYAIIKPIHSSVFTYLTRTLTSSPDQWTQLFVLIALADLKMTEAEKRQIEGCAKIEQIVKTCRKTFEGKDVDQWIKSIYRYRLKYQLYVCSSNWRKSIIQNSTNAIRSTSTISNLTTATLNPHDLTPQLTLSPCHLSARSDCHWQSVRSVCQVSAHIYYFEVVLLTDGPMTIGWATNRTDLSKITKIQPRYGTPIMVGFDEFSIGFDGFNRCIYHDNNTFQLENIPRWKAGDIVGCLIDISQKSFKFYLNGSLINFNPNQSPIYFSSQPYHSLLSLSQFQQVYLNFGQSPFSHRPKYIDFCDFYSNKSEVHEIQSKTVNVNFNKALKRNVITIDSDVKQRDIKFSSKVSTSKKSDKPTKPIGNISSVHTIASVNIEEVNNSQIKRSRMECRICCSSSATKLVRFVCCDMLPLCLDCLRVMTECPKCKKQIDDSQTGGNQPNEPKQTHSCTLCSKQQASFRFISCDHFNLCQTCVNQISFKDCPKCN